MLTGAQYMSTALALQRPTTHPTSPQAQAQLVGQLGRQRLQLRPLQQLTHRAHDEVAGLTAVGRGIR